MRQRTGILGAARFAGEGTPPLTPYAPVVKRARAMFGESLAGVVAFGSWMRGEATNRSDIDALVVLHPNVPIVRALYRDWDRDGEIEWGGVPLDVHFARLPTRASAFWGELALDGTVAFERGGAVSEALASAKAEIAAGRLRCVQLHGGRCWIDGAGE